VLLDDAVELVLVRTVTAEETLEHEFEARVEDSSSLAFRVALAVLRRREDAEDVAQDAFLRAHRAFAGLRERDRFRAWLVRTTFRLALDHQRGRSRRQRREDVFVAGSSPSASVEDELARRELQLAVGRAIDALPEKQRIVTVLAAIEGHDLRDVARLLELPEGTVKPRLHGARKALAESLRCLVNDIGRR
jgi:RNA polymerase sigma-70 factor (ECF subfamily)